MTKAYAVTLYDVEDVFLAQGKADTHGDVRKLAQLMSEEGLRGNFNLTGVKLRGPGRST